VIYPTGKNASTQPYIVLTGTLYTCIYIYTLHLKAGLKDTQELCSLAERVYTVAK